MGYGREALHQEVGVSTIWCDPRNCCGEGRWVEGSSGNIIYYSSFHYIFHYYNPNNILVKAEAGGQLLL